MIKIGTLIKDEEDVIWIVTNADDIHNIELKSKDGDGTWIDCFDPECEDNCFSYIKIL